MKGRDTGSDGYRTASRYVATEFERAGLKSAGTSGYFQSVPLHTVRFRWDQSEIALLRNGRVTRLKWFRDVTLAARSNAAEIIDAPLVFAGWEIPPELDIRDKILVALAPPRFQAGPRGYAQTPRPGYLGTTLIESTGGPEPLRWPSPYSAETITLASETQAPNANGLLFLDFNPAAADELLNGSGHTYNELRSLAEQGKHLPSFSIPSTLHVRAKFESEDLNSDNILAVLPGSDPTLASEFIVLSAHLDGFGVGPPINGDRIYNGALDDAAYVATLIDFAQRLHESGKKLKRSILFCVFTGEERGHLGSIYFLAHPTVPKEQMVADINLDELRPIFPLKILTTLALNESTLGETASQVGESRGIRIQPDAEPDRNLLRRSDHWSFMQAGIPALGFVFGYEKNSPEEAAYRRWYADRYHSPSDDLKQPWDASAVAGFNDFFEQLVEVLATAPERPKWKSGSP
jgi:hypothetical protein